MSSLHIEGQHAQNTPVQLGRSPFPAHATCFNSTEQRALLCLEPARTRTHSAMTRRTLPAYSAGFLRSSSEGLYTGRNCTQRWDCCTCGAAGPHPPV